MNFHDTVLPYCQGTCLFRSKGGHFGLAADFFHIRVEAGDKIIAVAGLKTALLVRPVDNCYRLLGQVYVNGLTNRGEWSKSENELGWIELV